MQLDIITPEKIIYSAAIAMVGVPGTLGDFGVLPGHAPFISTLRPGVITIDSADGNSRKLAVMAGLAEVTPEKCVILAENVVDCADLTLQYAEDKMEQAADELEAAQGDSAKKHAETKRQFAEVLRQQLS